MDPYTILRSAIRKVPAMKYALAVAGAGSVVAIVLGFKLKPQIAVFGTLIVIGLMFVLVVFSRYSTERATRTWGPANALVWFYTLAVIVCTSLLITSYFWQWPVPLEASSRHAGNAMTVDNQSVPVTLTAVRQGSLTPVTQTIFTVMDDTSRVIRQEVMPDSNGQVTFELVPGKYMLHALGATQNISFEVSPPGTTVTVQVASTESGPVSTALAAESVGIATGSSRSAFADRVFVSLISNTMTGNPASRKVSFTIGVRGGSTRTYQQQEVGSVARLEGFEVRLTDVFDWGAKFLIQGGSVTAAASVGKESVPSSGSPVLHEFSIIFYNGAAAPKFFIDDKPFLPTHYASGIATFQLPLGNHVIRAEYPTRTCSATVSLPSSGPQAAICSMK